MSPGAIIPLPNNRSSRHGQNWPILRLYRTHTGTTLQLNNPKHMPTTPKTKGKIFVQIFERGVHVYGWRLGEGGPGGLNRISDIRIVGHETRTASRRHIVENHAPGTHNPLKTLNLSQKQMRL